jgi:glycosyltransferase involved in cell wall biosynthesis
MLAIMAKDALWNSLIPLTSTLRGKTAIYQLLRKLLSIVYTCKGRGLVQNTPLVTIGIVAYNRAWIIPKMLASLQGQTYPHQRLFVVFVDGVSRDGTAEIAKQTLAASDFGGYEVIVQKCNIPQGRNICVEKMRGELLFFWDSDVIMPMDAIARLVEGLVEEKADLMTAVAKTITVSSVEEIAARLQETASPTERLPPSEIKAVMMGQTLLTRRLAEAVGFDPQLTIQEDTDFCLRARRLGFKLMIDPNTVVLDVNMFNVPYSDTCIDMSFRDAMKGIRRKSQVQAYGYSFSAGYKNNLRFFVIYKRYLFYLLYLPTGLFTLVGVWLQNIILTLVFPLFALVYIALQIRRRGVVRGIRAFALSIVVGIPTAVWVTVYWLQCAAKAPSKQSQS